MPAETVTADLANLRASADQDMRQGKWNTRHLGDVAAYCLLISYASVNARSSLSGQGTRAVRRTVSDEPARLRDACQQQLAEALMLRVGYYIGWANDRRARGDEAGAEGMRGELRDFIRGVYRLDPARVGMPLRETEFAVVEAVANCGLGVKEQGAGRILPRIGVGPTRTRRRSRC